MSLPADLPQLSLDVLASARAQVPSGLWESLKHREQLFVAAYLADPTMRKEAAAIAAGYKPSGACSSAAKLLKKATVLAAIDAAVAARASRTLITADDVLRRWWAIGTADANTIVQHRRACCRYCHGDAHEFQRTPAEMRRDRANFEDKQTKRSTATFDEQGGDGYDRRKPPHPECPECFGEGEASVFIADTRHLSGAAALLYAGVKETEKGVEVKLHDQGGALAQVARHLGMFTDKGEAPEDADTKAQKIRDAMEQMDLATTSDGTAC